MIRSCLSCYLHIHFSTARHHQERLSASMQNENLVSLHIGAGPKLTTLYVRRDILTRTSPCFASALTPQSTGDQANELSFPQDDLEAWRILQAWMPKHDLLLAKFKDLEKYLSAWYLAEEYEITQLQDDIMFEFIMLAHHSTHMTDIPFLKRWFANTRPGSLPRKVITEQIVYELKRRKEQNEDWKDSIAFTNNPSYATDFLAAMLASKAEPGLNNEKRFQDNEDGKGNPLWLRYMTADSKGPKDVKRRLGWEKDVHSRRWHYRWGRDEDFRELEEAVAAMDAE